MKRMSLFERLPSRRSFTLLELMLVMTIIVILIGMVLPVSTYVSNKMKEARSLALREKIVSALEEYRAEYGEYPINNGVYQDMIKHYTNNYMFDTNGISPWTNIDLITNGVEIPRSMPDDEVVTQIHYAAETMSLLKGEAENQLFVDYSLSYPLCIKPVLEGKKPFIDVPEQRVLYMVWKIPAGQESSYITPGGIKGNWLKRPVMVDPSSHHQWIYDCYDGLTYDLWLEDSLPVLKKGS